MAISRTIAVASAIGSVVTLMILGCSTSDPEVVDSSESVARLPAGEEVLERMLAAYGTADSYSDRAQYLRQTVRRDEGVQRDTLILEFSLRFQRPNKVRITSQREYPQSQRDETFDIANDGNTIRIASGELPEQIYETHAAAELTPENLIPEPNIRAAVLNVSIENLYPQLAMMLRSEDDTAVFPADHNPRVLDQRKLRDVNCYRVALDNPAGRRILWIDSERFVLMRMELPLEAQLSAFDPYGEFSHYAVLVDYIDPQLGKPIDLADFDLEVPPNARRVRRFVPPAPPAPPAEWGRPVADFAFVTLEGSEVTPAALAGKVALLEFWSQSCPPCKAHTPLLEQLYQTFKDDERFAFYAVNMDPAFLTNVAVRRLFGSWGGTIPILRDPSDDGYEKLGVRYFPHTILLGADGRVQFTFSGMHESIEPLAEKVRKLLAGEDLVAEANRRHARLVARAEADLKAAELADEFQAATLPQIPPRKLPEKFQLTTIWQTTAETLRRPGDVQLFGSKVLVLDQDNAIVELAADGNHLGRHPLRGQEKGQGILRVAASDTGRHWFAVSGIGWRQVQVLDDQWQNILTFPDESPGGVGGLLFADLAGAGMPLLYVGYQGSGGVQGVTLDGRRVWVNHSLDHVLQISPGPAVDGVLRQAWCTSSRGTITKLTIDGRVAGEFSVVGETITQVGPIPAADFGLTTYCGLASSGNGAHAAVGFDAEGEVAWRYDLPRGDYLHPIQAIHIAQLPGGESCWLVVAADGTLHWLDQNGKLLDRCEYGAAITGIAVSSDGTLPQLYVATDDELTAWQARENSPAPAAEPITEPSTETPAEE